MIHTIRAVAVGDQESKIDSPIILYRGDREVEVEFTINGSKFTFTNGGNVIKSTNATHGQLVINTPTGENMFSEVTECHDGKVIFVITKEMIDELIEVGFYSFQIRLFDESQVSRVTIPPVLKGIDIRNPIAAEDETNVVDIALVDYAVVIKDEFEDLSTFLPNGNYNKTEWESKDVISGAKLNKIEDALYDINSNMEATDLALLNQIERVNQNVKRDFKELSNEIESEVEELEQRLNNNINKFKNDVYVDIDSNKNVIESLNDVLSGKINVKEFGAKGDGVTDDSDAIDACLRESMLKNKVCFFPCGTYIVSRNWKFNNDHKVMIEGENYLNTSILLKESVTLDNYYLFDFEDCDCFSCCNLTSNLGFQLISNDTYFQGEVAWRLKLRKKDFVLKNCIVKGQYVQQGYQIGISSPCPDTYDRYSSPEYTQYPLEITNGSGYNAININNFATNSDGSIASPLDNSALGIVDAVANSTGVIFIDMMGAGRSFERYVSRNPDVINSEVRPGTVWEIHRNGHIAIGCSVDESEYGWNTVKLRDNNPSIRFIDANNNDVCYDLGVAKQSWGDEIYIKKGNVGVRFYIDGEDKVYLSGLSGGLTGGFTINQDTSINWDSCLKLKRTDGKSYGLGIDEDERLRHYYPDGNANLYANGKQGKLLQEASYGSARPTLMYSCHSTPNCATPR